MRYIYLCIIVTAFNGCKSSLFMQSNVKGGIYVMCTHECADNKMKLSIKGKTVEADSVGFYFPNLKPRRSYRIEQLENGQSKVSHKIAVKPDSIAIVMMNIFEKDANPMPAYTPYSDTPEYCEVNFTLNPITDLNMEEYFSNNPFAPYTYGFISIGNLWSGRLTTDAPQRFTILKGAYAVSGRINFTDINSGALYALLNYQKMDICNKTIPLRDWCIQYDVEPTVYPPPPMLSYCNKKYQTEK
jgi:hypothetical protein